MGLFNVVKKKGAPKELPDLARPSSQQPTSQQTSVPSYHQQAPARQVPEFKPRYKPLPITREAEPQQQGTPPAIADIPFRGPKEEKTFYRDILQTITQEMHDVDKIDDWYKNKFLSEDVLKKMQSYWEQRKPELVVQNIGQDLKVKISEHSERLHTLEKEWQDIYFALISKEDLIRKEEREVKKLVTEYMDLCKRALKQSERRFGRKPAAKKRSRKTTGNRKRGRKTKKR